MCILQQLKIIINKRNLIVKEGILRKNILNNLKDDTGTVQGANKRVQNYKEKSIMMNQKAM